MFIQFTVRPTLNPSSKESEREYYLRMERREDCSDDVIDGLTKLLEGDVILCSAADPEERNDEIRSSHVSRDPAMHSRSFPASSAHEQMIRSFSPVAYQQHPMPTSPTSLEPATASRSFPAIPTHEQIGASTPREVQTYGPMPTFSTHFGPQTHSAIPASTIPTLESLMHYIDRRIGEHESYMKSMLANHEAVMMQKMEENSMAIMKKIESALAMNKDACSGGVNVEFERDLSRGVGTRYSGGDNFECQQRPLQDEQVRDGAAVSDDRVVGMHAEANVENVKNHDKRPKRRRKRAPVLLSPYVVQLPKRLQPSMSDVEKQLQAPAKPTKTL